jgi:hypothetical protein
MRQGGNYFDEFLNRRCAMRALLRRFRSTADVAADVTFAEARGEVCDTSCRASASLDRARTNALLFR